MPVIQDQKAYIWSLRIKTNPNELIGIIGLYNKHAEGMKVIRTETKEYVSGKYDCEIWELTKEDWCHRQQLRLSENS
ncbi:hypothetical protein [Xenorhabdus siamensis]|uniref:hypothetical protein n=1 Tax=Xenorhabdus siamensis TaxID=3136254 RepID=UPI0030F38DC3